MQDLSTRCAPLHLNLPSVIHTWLSQCVLLWAKHSIGHAALYPPYLSYFTTLTRFVLFGGIQRGAAMRGWHVWQPNRIAEQCRLHQLPDWHLLLRGLHRGHQLQRRHLRRSTAQPAVHRVPRGHVPGSTGRVGMQRVRQRLHVPRGLCGADSGVVPGRHVPRLGVQRVRGLPGGQHVRGRCVAAAAVQPRRLLRGGRVAADRLPRGALRR